MQNLRRVGKTLHLPPVPGIHRAVSDLQTSLSMEGWGTSSHWAPARAMSCFTVWIQSILGRPGFLLLPARVQLSADWASESFGILHTWPAHRSRRSENYMPSNFKPFVNQSSWHFKTTQETPCSLQRTCPIMYIMFSREDIGR